jgi:hypothetical protein
MLFQWMFMLPIIDELFYFRNPTLFISVPSNPSITGPLPKEGTILILKF